MEGKCIERGRERGVGIFEMKIKIKNKNMRQ